MNDGKTALKPITKDETIQWKGIAISCVILGHMNLLPEGGRRRRNFSGFKWLWDLSILYIKKFESLLDIKTRKSMASILYMGNVGSTVLLCNINKNV